MLNKIKLYAGTIRYLKPGQIFWRIGKHFGLKCSVKGVSPSRRYSHIQKIAVSELDNDPVFLKRFSVEDLMNDQVTFLHEKEVFCWEGRWHVDGRSPLWNFNLHYFEYLHPLTARYIDTGEEKYLNKTRQMIRGWISQNAKRSGEGWSAYTISLRLTNWMSYVSEVGEHLDASFRQELEASIQEQYIYLSKHLEKDILGNHYFENLKALVLCALFFGDLDAGSVYLQAFCRECQEEILTDGMHFELSPMYHKVVLEGLLRVVIALREVKEPNTDLEQKVQAMLDAIYTMEQGLSRTPLFNDSGDNVAKSLKALMDAAKIHLGIVPVQKQALIQSGYYFFESGPWRLIVDAGAAGPRYIPGHSHCDAMSFELFHTGEPFLVNCGTYAYQCAERNYFRSTESHNTVQVRSVEQSEIWGIFRLARRSRTCVLSVWNNGIQMEMTDYKGNRICREIKLNEDSLSIKDCSEGNSLQSYLHSITEIKIDSNAYISRGAASYAPEYGKLQMIHKVTAKGKDKVELTVPLR